MAFAINNNSVFIDSMQFMNYDLDTMVKNLSTMGFKYLSQEICSDLLKSVKQKRVYPYEYMDSFKKFFNEKLLDRSKFYSSLKAECMSEIDVWNVFRMNTMGDYHHCYFKSRYFIIS